MLPSFPKVTTAGLPIFSKKKDKIRIALFNYYEGDYKNCIKHVEATSKDLLPISSRIITFNAGILVSLYFCLTNKDFLLIYFDNNFINFYILMSFLMIGLSSYCANTFYLEIWLDPRAYQSDESYFNYLFDTSISRCNFIFFSMILTMMQYILMIISILYFSIRNIN